MADDWKVGDLALAVTDVLPGYRPAKMIVPGRVYTVIRVYISRSMPGLIGLVLREATPTVHPGFDSRIFRKIHPHTPDAEDLRTIAELTGDFTTARLDAMIDGLRADAGGDQQ